MSSHALLQGIFQTQGLNPGFLHWRQILYCLRHQGGTSKQRVKTPNADGGRECEGSWLDGEHGKQEQMFLLQGAAAIQLKSPAM